jgi:hypothetical protein
VDGTEWGQEAQRVTADVTKDARILVFLQYLIQGSIDIAVTASLTECWWTGNNVFARLK